MRDTSCGGTLAEVLVCMTLRLLTRSTTHYPRCLLNSPTPRRRGAQGLRTNRLNAGFDMSRARTAGELSCKVTARYQLGRSYTTP